MLFRSPDVERLAIELLSHDPSVSAYIVPPGQMSFVRGMLVFDEVARDIGLQFDFLNVDGMPLSVVVPEAYLAAQLVGYSGSRDDLDQVAIDISTGIEEELNADVRRTGEIWLGQALI